MNQIRDAIYYEQLARVARSRAAASDDADVRLRLREAAVRHERRARQIRQTDAKIPLEVVEEVKREGRSSLSATVEPVESPAPAPTVWSRLSSSIESRFGGGSPR